jgi:putative heme-binding domain-containing protein
MDFAFDPLTGRATSASGNGQFGLTFDNFANRFFCNNRAPIEHVVLESRYLERNPYFAAGTAVASVAASGEQSHVFPLVRAWTTSNLHEGQFTAACGLEIYRGAALGEEYEGNAFVCEPTGSLVHRELVCPVGVTFTAEPAQAGKEFLASRDSWFRPVNLEVGPDGALYVVDMHRAVIEHPQFMPSELQKRPDLRLGDDRGRIYRVVRKAATRVPTPQLSKANPTSLVRLLAHPNAWWRETAARLLLEGQDHGVVDQLTALARDGNALARVNALSVLAGFGQIETSTLLARLADSQPRVREFAVRLAEAQLEHDSELCAAVARAADDPDARVRFQAALSLGATRNATIPAALAKIAIQGAGDAWVRKAVCTSKPEIMASIWRESILLSPSEGSGQPEHRATLSRELAQVVGARGERDEIECMLVTLTTAAGSPELADAAVLGLCEGSLRHGQPLARLIEASPPGSARARGQLDRTFERAVQTAIDTAADEHSRTRAIQLVRHAGTEEAGNALLRLAMSDASSSIRTRAVAALVGYSDETIAHELLASMDAQSPVARQAILDLLMVRAGSARSLLAAVADKKLARAELGLSRENALRNHADAETRAFARTVLAVVVDSDRARVLARYQHALELTPDAAAGKALFAKHCANCHRIEGVGHEVGPDISDLRTKTPAQLLVDILNPNQAIDNNYVSYTVSTTTGTVHTGIIAAETPSSIRLRQAEGKSLDLLRTEIESLRSSGISLMPEGVEKELGPQQVADVIAYLKNWRYVADPAAAKLAPAAK